MGKNQNIVSANLSDDLYEWLLKETERDDRTKSSIMVRALKEYRAKRKAHAEMLPDLSGKLYSNGDIGEELGMPNRHVMKRGRALGFVAPEGEGNEYGTWKMSKSSTSSHECPQWFWSEAGRKRIIDSLRNPAA